MKRLGRAERKKEKQLKEIFFSIFIEDQNMVKVYLFIYASL